MSGTSAGGKTSFLVGCEGGGGEGGGGEGGGGEGGGSEDVGGEGLPQAA